MHGIIPSTATDDTKELRNPKTQDVHLGMGMPIIAHKANKKLNICNSDRFVVKSIKENQKVFKNDFGTVEIRVSSFHKFFYIAFCTTIYSFVKVLHFSKNIRFTTGKLLGIHRTVKGLSMGRCLMGQRNLTPKYIKMVNTDEISQLAGELLKRALDKFPRRTVRALLPVELLAADLVDMSNVKNKTKNYLLT